MAMERGRQGGRSRSRHPKDDDDGPLLSSAEFKAEIRQLFETVMGMSAEYARAHEEGAWPPGGSGVHVSGGNPSDATVAALEGREQRARRQNCRTAVKWLREAQSAATKARKALKGEPVLQPEKVDDRATVTQSDFDRSRARRGFTTAQAERSHREREEELRRG